MRFTHEINAQVVEGSMKCSGNDDTADHVGKSYNIILQMDPGIA